MKTTADAPFLLRKDAVLASGRIENTTAVQGGFPFPEQMSEQSGCLKERTTHSCSMGELSATSFTREMKQLTDITVPFSSQSSTSRFPGELPVQKSNTLRFLLEEKVSVKNRKALKQGNDSTI